MNNVLIIGCGHMGSALLDLWSKNKLYKFTVVDPLKYKIIKGKFNNKRIQSIASVKQIKNIHYFDIVVLAVKPQAIEKVLNEYKFFSFKKTCVLISIMAGKKITFLKKLLPKIKQIVRVMPNMPALIGEGVSCLISNNYVSNLNKNKVTKLFSKVGITVWLNNEREIDIVTAISGSGPGYVFYLIDAMEKAANHLGLSKKLNKKIILQTFLGSLKLLQHSSKNASELANSIAIKGGTTEAGIKIMKKNDIHKILLKTLLSAYQKANLLGKN